MEERKFVYCAHYPSSACTLAQGCTQQRETEREGRKKKGKEEKERGKRFGGRNAASFSRLCYT